MVNRAKKYCLYVKGENKTWGAVCQYFDTGRRVKKRRTTYVARLKDICRNI